MAADFQSIKKISAKVKATQQELDAVKAEFLASISPELVAGLIDEVDDLTLKLKQASKQLDSTKDGSLPKLKSTIHKAVDSSLPIIIQSFPYNNEQVYALLDNEAVLGTISRLDGAIVFGFEKVSFSPVANPDKFVEILTSDLVWGSEDIPKGFKVAKAK